MKRQLYTGTSRLIKRCQLPTGILRDSSVMRCVTVRWFIVLFPVTVNFKGLLQPLFSIAVHCSAFLRVNLTFTMLGQLL